MSRAQAVRGASPWHGVLATFCFVTALCVMPLRAQSSIPAPGPCDTGTTNNGACRMHLVLTTTIQSTRSLSVLPSADFSLTPASGQLEASDFDAGTFDVAGKLTVQVSSTSAWRVTVQATTGAMTGACSARAASTIQWGLTPAARTTPLSASPVSVASGSSYVVNQPLDVYFRVSLDWLRDGPVSGTNCTLPIAFTVTSP